MLREKLRDIDLRITELADYLQISRPTMYKYIDEYDAKRFVEINNKVLKLFDYISNNPLIGKKTVINYILNHLVEVKELETKSEANDISSIRKFIIDNPGSKKSEFIKIITEKKCYDNVIEYLMDIYPLIKKRKLTDDEIEKLRLYDEINNLYEGEQ